MKNKIFKLFILICLVFPAVFMFGGCMDNSNNDLEQKLSTASVLILDGLEYKSNTIEAQANTTYYFKVTNYLEQPLKLIKAYNVDESNAPFENDQAFGIEGTNAFWIVKVYNSNKQKVDFIGSFDGYLYDPMAEIFKLNTNDTCYFAVTFIQNVNFVFSFGAEV